MSKDGDQLDKSAKLANFALAVSREAFKAGIDPLNLHVCLDNMFWMGRFSDVMRAGMDTTTIQNIENSRAGFFELNGVKFYNDHTLPDWMK